MMNKTHYTRPEHAGNRTPSIFSVLRPCFCPTWALGHDLLLNASEGPLRPKEGHMCSISYHTIHCPQPHPLSSPPFTFTIQKSNLSNSVRFKRLFFERWAIGHDLLLNASEGPLWPKEGHVGTCGTPAVDIGTDLGLKGH